MGKSGRGQQSLATSAEAVSDSVVCVEGWTSARSCIRSRYLNYERPWRKADRPDPSHQLSQITKRTAKHAFWALTIPSNLICDCLLQTSLSDLENETSAVTKLVQRSELNKNGKGVRQFDLQTDVHARIRTSFLIVLTYTIPFTLLVFHGCRRTSANHQERLP